MRRAALGAATLVAVAALAFALYRSGAVQLVRPDPARCPIRGIDVSHHQGAIDWLQVAGDGVQFAYPKATEGRDHTDARFAANWSASAAAGSRAAPTTSSRSAAPASLRPSTSFAWLRRRGTR